MANPTPSDVHVNAPLTNISVAYIQNASRFVASQVFPNVPVSKQSDRYYTYERGDFNRDEMAVRAPGAESAGGGYRLDNTPTYYAPVWSFHKDVDDQLRANADSMLAVDREATIFCTQKALIRREKLFATNYFTGGVWTNDWDGVASSPSGSQVLQWNDANSNPIENIRSAGTTIAQSTGFEPNTLVIGRAVYDALVDHPDIVARISGGATTSVPALVNQERLAQLLGIDRVLVMNGIENTAAEGASASHSFIGGKKALLCYSAPTPGLMTPSAGYTFSWTGMNGAGADGARIKSFRMEHLASDRIEIEMAFDMKLVAADLGFFWDTIVA